LLRSHVMRRSILFGLRKKFGKAAIRSCDLTNCFSQISHRLSMA
jgi:hypothetical protein